MLGVPASTSVSGGAAGTVSNVTNAFTVVNGTGSGSLSVTGNCASAGSMTINWANANGHVLRFHRHLSQAGGRRYPVGGRMYLYRQSDATAFTNGTYWTPEMVALRSGNLNLRTIVAQWGGMSLSGQGDVQTDVASWSYRKTTESSYLLGGSRTTSLPARAAVARLRSARSLCPVARSRPPLLRIPI